MTNDPTTTPAGEADLAKPPRTRSAGRATAAADLHPEMMGDETEEQNLGQAGDPSARIGEAEVAEAFGARPAEPRSFQGDGQKPDRLTAMADKLTESLNTVRGQVQQSAQTAKAWAAEQSRVAKQAAAEKPVLALSASAGAALAVGLALGFVLGRTTAED